MPHVIIEYSNSKETESESELLLNEIHLCVQNSGLFEKENVKTRLIPVNKYRIGTSDNTFTHIQLRIHTGRSSEQKKHLSTQISECIRKINWPTSIVTVEIVEMDKESYSKFENSDVNY